MTVSAREVLVVVRRESEYLVLHRSPAKGAYWHTVAGRVEPGEEWREAAARELLEETSLAGAELRELTGFDYVRERWEADPGLRVAVRTFLVDAPAGWEPTLDHEHDDARWCTREEAVGLLFWPEPARIVASLA